jgi:hypothetical protein
MHPYLKPLEIEKVAEAVKVAVRGPVGVGTENPSR